MESAKSFAGRSKTAPNARRLIGGQSESQRFINFPKAVDVVIYEPTVRSWLDDKCLLGSGNNLQSVLLGWRSTLSRASKCGPSSEKECVWLFQFDWSGCKPSSSFQLPRCSLRFSSGIWGWVQKTVNLRLSTSQSCVGTASTPKSSDSWLRFVLRPNHYRMRRRIENNRAAPHPLPPYIIGAGKSITNPTRDVWTVNLPGISRGVHQ